MPLKDFKNREQNMAIVSGNLGKVLGLIPKSMRE